MRAAEKAKFCVSTGIAPSEFEGLTQVEITAFTKEHNRQAKRRR